MAAATQDASSRRRRVQLLCVSKLPSPRKKIFLRAARAAFSRAHRPSVRRTATAQNVGVLHRHAALVQHFGYRTRAAGRVALVRHAHREGNPETHRKVFNKIKCTSNQRSSQNFSALFKIPSEEGSVFPIFLFLSNLLLSKGRGFNQSNDIEHVPLTRSAYRCVQVLFTRRCSST